MIKEHLTSVGEEILSRGNTPDMSMDLLPVFNRRIWGISKKKLTIIGARPSNGKTSLGLQMAYDISKHKRVLFLSLESDITELTERLFCMVMKIDNQDLKSRGLKAYLGKWSIFADELGKRKLVITHEMGKNWDDIQAILDNLNPLPDLIILDYIQCIKNRKISKMEAIEEYIKSFRESAIKRNFAIILLSQINRMNTEGSKPPTMSGLKGSGSLEEHSDKVLLCHWEYHEDNSKSINEFKIIIAKNKSGLTGAVTLRYDPQWYRLSEPTEDDYYRSKREELRKKKEGDRKLQFKQ